MWTRSDETGGFLEDADVIPKNATTDDVIPKLEYATSDYDSSSDYDTELEENEITITSRQIAKEKLEFSENVGIGHRTYEQICQSEDEVPIRRIAEQLPLTTMRLQHIGINNSHCKALACALWHNTCIDRLDLEDNGLTSASLVMVLNVCRNKLQLTSLSLSENEIDSEAAMALSDLLRDTTFLTQLNLSGTKLGDKEVSHVAAGLQLNSTLLWLDLSHNNISIEGSKKLGRALGDTATLQSLNISWNHIRLAGAVGILKGLKINNSIMNLDLGMNGLGFEGSLQLEETLHENTTLKFLDISNNRINWEGVSYVAKGLKKNGTLTMLKIGSNPINMEGCYELLKSMAHKKSKVVHVSLENVPVNGAVVTVASEIMKHRQFSMVHGGILDTRDVVGIRKERPEDPISLVVRYLATVGIRIIDLFRMFDADNDGFVSRREFIRGLKRVGVPLSDRALHNVATRLDKHKKGQISYGLLSQGVRNHIREERKEDKRQEVKKKNRLEERRRILQTELPEIYKHHYEQDMYMFYGGNQSFANMSSPHRSSSASMGSMNGNQVPVLPPIGSVASSTSSIANIGTSVSDRACSPTSEMEPFNGESVSKRIASSTGRQGHINNSFKLMRVINAYLDRRKTSATFDTNMLSKLKTKS